MTDTTTTTTDDAGTTDNAGTTTTTDDAGTKDATVTAAEFAAFKAKFAQLETEHAANKTELEAARRSKLSDAQRLEEDKAAVAKDRAALKGQALAAAAERVGLNKKTLPMLGDIDVLTADGQAALEKFVRDNPEFVSKGTGSGTPASDGPAPKSRMQQLIDGKLSHPMFSRETVLGIFGRSK